MPDFAYACEGEEAHSYDDYPDGHDSARSVAICQSSNERGQQSRTPGAGRNRERHGLAVPAHILVYEVLNPSEDDLRDTCRGVGPKADYAQHDPSVEYRSARSPGDDALRPPHCADCLVESSPIGSAGNVNCRHRRSEA